MSDIRTQARRAFYGNAIGKDILKVLPVFSSNSFLNTATAGVATGNYATAVGALVGNTTDLQGRDTRAYILEKHYLSGRYWTGFWYFGKCVDGLGRVIPGTERLNPYPLRVYADGSSGSTGYYGTLPLGVQGVQGRIVVTGARMDFRKSSATAGSNGVAADGQGAGIKAYNTNTSVTSGGVAAAAAGLYFGLSQGVIATNALMTAVENTTGTGASTSVTSVTDDDTAFPTCNLIKYTTIGTLSSGLQNMAAASAVLTKITDNTAGTASSTFAAITSTVTSTVVANALAQLALNENRRLGLMGKIVSGTSAVQGLFLNVDSVTQADGTGATYAYADDGVVGELLINGVVEVEGLVVGDI